MLLSGCGNFGAGFFQNPNGTTTTTTTGSDYVYSVNSDSTISAFSVGSGALTAISGNPISPGSAFSATVSRADTYVFVGGSTAIYCYAIGSGGALTEQTSGGYGGSVVTDYIAMDTSPNGDYLAALSQVAGTEPVLNIFSINTSTCLLKLQTSVSIPLSNTTTLVTSSLHFSPNGAFIGVALGENGDYIFPFTQTSGAVGTSSYLALATNTEDNYLLFDPTNTYAYIGRYGLSAGTGSVVTYTVSSSGALTELSSVSSGNGVKSLVLNSAGTDLYTANFSDNTISGYSVASGALKALTGSPYDGSAGVTSLALDNSGKYVIAAGSGGSGTTDLTLYEFDALNAGQLDAVATYANGSGAAGSVAVAATH
jgi:6-phosphogluconolactonase (cycloisomerase 2 family)